MIHITHQVTINEADITITFVRSPGPGGQKVNKVSTAVLLRFNVRHASSINDEIREILLSKLASRLTRQGDLLIHASRHRTQVQNKADALERLEKALKRALTPIKKRKKTKPTKASIKRRLVAKKQRSATKSLRFKGDRAADL